MEINLSDPVSHSNYLYHYTTPQGVALIADSGNIRFGAYINTNDPKENQQWYPVVTSKEEDPPPELGELTELTFEVDKYLRKSARVGCFTLDQDASEIRPLEDYPPYHRGWARARMWAQYGANHRGACLVFDKDRLLAAVNDVTDSRDWDRSRFQFRLYSGPVDYADKRHIIDVNIKDMRERRHEALLLERMNGVQERFFSKFRDWSSEREFRIVVMCDDQDEPPMDIPIKDSLVVVIVGEDFPVTERSVLPFRMEKAGLAGVPLLNCSWLRQTPSLSAYA